MGKLASASTVYATAYLTERGRKYLFNQGKWNKSSHSIERRSDSM